MRAIAVIVVLALLIVPVLGGDIADVGGEELPSEELTGKETIVPTVKETIVPTSTFTAKPTVIITTPTLTPVTTQTISIKPTLEILSEELVVWKSIEPISETKTPITSTSVKSLSVVSTMLFEAEVDSVPVEKTLQVYPQSKVTISKDYEAVMQQSESKDSPPVELYYGYQKSRWQPWQYYYRVDGCGESVCRIVRAEFDSRRVWLEDVPTDKINELSASGVIPEYESVPDGIEVTGVTAL